MTTHDKRTNRENTLIGILVLTTILCGLAAAGISIYTKEIVRTSFPNTEDRIKHLSHRVEWLERWGKR